MESKLSASLAKPSLAGKSSSSKIPIFLPFADGLTTIMLMLAGVALQCCFIIDVASQLIGFLSKMESEKL